MSDKAKTDKSARIGEILDVMRNTWDLPADCNEGELYTYAEILLDRIEAGEDKTALHAFLAETRAKLDMPSSDAALAIAERAVALTRG